ncbi:MAG: hypothetical protein M3N93_11125 [Acidobacteriota bacterium]|nr:hypothetical protein [Acidobacteriota bacterium]
MIQRRLAIVNLQGTSNVPGLLNYTPAPDPSAAQPAPTMGHAQWIVAGLAAFAGLAILTRMGAKR